MKTQIEEPIMQPKIQSMKETWLAEGDDKKDKYQKLKSRQIMNKTSNFSIMQKWHKIQ